MTEGSRFITALIGGTSAWRRDGGGPSASLSAPVPTRTVANVPAAWRVVAASPSELGSLAWALAPLVTVGMAAAPCFAYAAVRCRSRVLALAAGAYALVSAAIVWGNVVRPGSILELDIGVCAVLLLWTVSSLHALAVRHSVFVTVPEEEAVVAAKDRIRRRDESRRIAATDPRLARELGIGRPDRPSSYDDGGLLDVNHLAGACLRDTGGLDAAVVNRIIDARNEVGSFDGLHDLELLAGLDPGSLDEVADRLVFCR
jgi:hypothetical protein